MSDFNDQIVQMQETIARIEQKLDQMTIAQAAIRDLREIKNRVYKEAISGARERREIFSILDNIQKSIADLQTKAGTQLDRRTAIPSTELRVGIFVDVQNIFYAASSPSCGRRATAAPAAGASPSPDSPRTGRR